MVKPWIDTIYCMQLKLNKMYKLCIVLHKLVCTNHLVYPQIHKYLNLNLSNHVTKLIKLV